MKIGAGWLIVTLVSLAVLGALPMAVALAHHIPNVPAYLSMPAFRRQFFRGCVLIAGEVSISDETTTEVVLPNGDIRITKIEVVRRNKNARATWIEAQRFDPDLPGRITSEVIIAYFEAEHLRPFIIYDTRTDIVYWDVNEDGHFDGYANVEIASARRAGFLDGACSTLRAIRSGQLKSVRADRVVKH